MRILVLLGAVLYCATAVHAQEKSVQPPAKSVSGTRCAVPEDDAALRKIPEERQCDYNSGDAAGVPQGQQPSLPLAQSHPDEQKKQKAPDKLTQEQRTGTSNDRLFWTLPNYLSVENIPNLPPLSAGAKFKVVARSSFDLVEYPCYGFLAGISQAENSEPGYGQGAAGYGKRYGAAFADGTIESFITGAILPSILRQDPRYYQLSRGGFWHRTSYAVSRIFFTRTDSGKAQFNFSEIFGSALSAGVSTYSYHPISDRTVRNSLKVWGTQVGYDTISLVLEEFWPDVRRHFKK
ncbi:MAG TPA: hypothetical protein VJY15_05375 [Candidatus Acidoferrum sp.]|nr:hypothetical protein [Candidatus Acidoferrum sp.]